MRLVTFYADNDTRLGLLEGDQIVDLNVAAPELPGDMLGFLRAGQAALTHTRAALARRVQGSKRPLLHSAASARLAPPIPRPGKIICIGLNYSDHAAESGQPVPQRPVVFAKFGTSVIGPKDAIRWSPDVTQQVDYEAELAVVIGRTARQVSQEDALEYVVGYMCANDVSARDLQFIDANQWVRGKSLDTFCPLGPYLVTRDEVPDPGALSIRCILNGQTMQDSTTANLIFDVPTLVSYLSHSFTLEPGDIILTGTPPGVGSARKPPVFMKPGDHVVVEVEGLGRLDNTVI